MEVSQETIVITSDIPDSSDIPDTPLELFWDAHWTLDDDDWSPDHSLALL